MSLIYKHTDISTKTRQSSTARFFQLAIDTIEDSGYGLFFFFFGFFYLFWKDIFVHFAPKKSHRCRFSFRLGFFLPFIVKFMPMSEFVERRKQICGKPLEDFLSKFQIRHVSVFFFFFYFRNIFTWLERAIRILFTIRMKHRGQETRRTLKIDDRTFCTFFFRSIYCFFFFLFHLSRTDRY